MRIEQNEIHCKAYAAASLSNDILDDLVLPESCLPFTFKLFNIMTCNCDYITKE